MSRLATTTRLDIMIQARSKLYVIAIGMAVIFGLLIRILFPQEWLSVALPLFYFLGIGGTAYLFVGGMVIYEKGEHTLDAQVVSPLRVNEYLISKVVSLLIVVLLESTIVLLISYGLVGVNLLLLFAGITFMSVGMTLGGFAQVARYDTVSDYIVPAAIVLVLLQIPILYLTGLSTSPIWLLVPSTAPTLLMQAAFEPLPAWKIAYGLGYSLLWTGLLAWAARRAFNQHIIMRGG